MIIGIAGKMGCGKDYTCNNIVIPVLKHYNETFLQVSFADQIKINIMTKNDIQFDDVYVNKTKQTRRLLQIEGTENGRDILGKDIWIRYLHNWIKVHESRGTRNFICTDVRFLNEFDYIKKRGGIVIRIDAPQRNMERLLSESDGDSNILKSLQKHRSECDLDNLTDNHFDLVIKNDSGTNILDYYPELLEIYNNKKHNF
jgi:dephospho-CoA kinase